MTQLNLKPYETDAPDPQESVMFRSRNTKQAEEAVVETKEAAPETAQTARIGARPASQQDVIELHKRVVTMFATLNEGLTETAQKRAAEDRAAIDARVDGLEKSLNSLEGMLRIELVPQIRTLIGEEIADKKPIQKRRIARGIWFVAIMAACVFAGSSFSSEVNQVASLITSELSSIVK